MSSFESGTRVDSQQHNTLSALSVWQVFDDPLISTTAYVTHRELRRLVGLCGIVSTNVLRGKRVAALRTRQCQVMVGEIQSRDSVVDVCHRGMRINSMRLARETASQSQSYVFVL